MKRGNHRGNLFNTFRLKNTSIHIESYTKDLPFAYRPVPTFDAENVLFAEKRQGNNRIRLIYYIPKGTVRVLGLHDSYFTRAFGAAYASLLSGYLAASPASSCFEPCYFYVEENFLQNHPVIASVLHVDRKLADIICSAIDYIVTDNSVALHGRFTMGAVLVEPSTSALHIMSGMSSFMGPVEYDLASALQNTVERIAIAAALSTPVAGLVQFFHTLVDGVSIRHPVSQRHLYHLLVYMYLGHINFYLGLQEKVGGNIFNSENVRASVRRYALITKALVQKEPLP